MSTQSDFQDSTHDACIATVWKQSRMQVVNFGQALSFAMPCKDMQRTNRSEGKIVSSPQHGSVYCSATTSSIYMHTLLCCSRVCSLPSHTSHGSTQTKIRGPRRWR